jgi:BMFP domain-containing protein YqiC
MVRNKNVMHRAGAVGAKLEPGVKFRSADSTEQGKTMPQDRMEELSAKIREILATSPAKDLEKNLRAMLGAVFDKLELATRAELEIQQKVLGRTREKVAALESRLAELEAKLRQR